MCRVWLLSVWVYGLSLCLACFSAEAVDDLAPQLEEIRQESALPGMAAVAFRWNTMLGIGVSGVRKSGEEVPLTTADKFHLGSITKSMTATLAAMLVERGSLKWETRVGDVWETASIHEDYRDVDLRLPFQ